VSFDLGVGLWAAILGFEAGCEWPLALLNSIRFDLTHGSSVSLSTPMSEADSEKTLDFRLHGGAPL
jgi:hypothetical protein